MVRRWAMLSSPFGRFGNEVNKVYNIRQKYNNCPKVMMTGSLLASITFVITSEPRTSCHVEKIQNQVQSRNFEMLAIGCSPQTKYFPCLSSLSNLFCLYFCLYMKANKCLCVQNFGCGYETKATRKPLSGRKGRKLCKSKRKEDFHGKRCIMSEASVAPSDDQSILIRSSAYKRNNQLVPSFDTKVSKELKFNR